MCVFIFVFRLILEDRLCRYEICLYAAGGNPASKVHMFVEKGTNYNRVHRISKSLTQSRVSYHIWWLTWFTVTVTDPGVRHVNSWNTQLKTIINVDFRWLDGHISNTKIRFHLWKSWIWKSVNTGPKRKHFTSSS